MKDWKRPKVLESLTINLPSPLGTLNLTFGYDGNRLVEIMGEIGRGGTYGELMLSIQCRLISIILQSSLSRAKVMKKLKQNFFGVNWGTPFKYEDREYTGIEDLIFKLVVREIATKKLWKMYLKNKEGGMK